MVGRFGDALRALPRLCAEAIRSLLDACYLLHQCFIYVPLVTIWTSDSDLREAETDGFVTRDDRTPVPASPPPLVRTGPPPGPPRTSTEPRVFKQVVRGNRTRRPTVIKPRRPVTALDVVFYQVCERDSRRCSGWTPSSANVSGAHLRWGFKPTCTGYGIICTVSLEISAGN
ncbi:Hypp1994 [Branchiostoma lanceolatum]|uniref:Hypp1994 protein n=1 Tax=Branchiostoma lanceolatum TaxID=7740 RepID=A0A8J9ZQ76_BRALA|nr:Hypp1994 [Branchiostoma lanceolatum]